MEKQQVEVIFFGGGDTLVATRGVDKKNIPELSKQWVGFFIEFLESKGVDVYESVFYMPTAIDFAGKPIKTDKGYKWHEVKG